MHIIISRVQQGNIIIAVLCRTVLSVFQSIHTLIIQIDVTIHPSIDRSISPSIHRSIPSSIHLSMSPTIHWYHHPYIGFVAYLPIVMSELLRLHLYYDSKQPLELSVLAAHKRCSYIHLVKRNAMSLGHRCRALHQEGWDRLMQQLHLQLDSSYKSDDGKHHHHCSHRRHSRDCRNRKAVSEAVSLYAEKVRTMTFTIWAPISSFQCL